MKRIIIAAVLLALLNGCSGGGQQPSQPQMPGETPSSSAGQEVPQTAQRSAQEETEQQPAQQPEQEQQDEGTQAQTAQTEEEPPSPAAGTVLASFSTPLTDAGENRVSNIRTALEALGGYVVESGAEFSFNDVVGPRTPERGYRQAHVASHGKEVNGYGGGICQISTTLYNVVSKLGLPVTERHAHQIPVKYIEQGRDAAVVYGQQDFKFRNTLGYGIKITGYLEDNRLVMVVSAG